VPTRRYGITTIRRVIAQKNTVLKYQYTVTCSMTTASRSRARVSTMDRSSLAHYSKGLADVFGLSLVPATVQYATPPYMPTPVGSSRNLSPVCIRQYRNPSSSGIPRGGGWGVQTPPPRNSEVLRSPTGLQIERKMFSVPIPKS
jgi:hypothetical protein